MAETDIWMPLYVDDYIADTRHLSTAEHGAYFLLIMHAWRKGGALPRDAERLRRIAGMSAKEWKASWPTLAEMFVETDGGFRHKRIDHELERAKTIRDQRSEAGKSAAARMTPEQRKARAQTAAKARWDANENANEATNGEQTNSLQDAIQPQPQPQPQPQQEEDSRKVSSLPPAAFAFSGRVIRLNRRDFDQWATAYHAITDLAAELRALDDWLRDNDDPTLAKRWFQVVSAALSKKHQAALREASKPGSEWGGGMMSPC